MKRFWIGSAILVGVLILGIISSHWMSRVHIPCAMDLQNAASYAMGEDWIRADALAHRAEESWERNRGLSAAFTNHQPMDEIDALFEELEIYLAREEAVAFSAACRYLSQRLKDIDGSFRVNWKNLF